MGKFNLLLITILLIIGNGCLAANPFSGCEDDSWYPFKDEKCVKFVDRFLSHEDAQIVCQVEFGSAHLVHVKSAEEQEFLTNLIFGVYQVVDNVWLGAHRRVGGGGIGTEFEWDTGIDLQYTHWAEGYPTDDVEKNCSQLSSHLTKTLLITDGEWMDESCIRRNLVVCQKGQNWTFNELEDHFLELKSRMDNLHLPDAEDPTTIKNCGDVQSPQNFPEALSRRFVLKNKKYDIYPPGLDNPSGGGGGKKKVSVQCDFETDGGGWTVIMRRRSGPKEQFYLDWVDYEEGFGSVDENYWIGLKAMHALTSNGAPQEMRVELGDWDGTHGWAKYNLFTVGNSIDLYRLSVGGYSGNVGDSMAYHNGLAFSTNDNDNDVSSGNCALTHHGAWWYRTCGYSILTGYYYPNSTTEGGSVEGLYWYHWKGGYHSLQNVEMKIRDLVS